MDNRRQDERIAFPAAERPSVRLELPGRRESLTGSLLDLSVRGMRVRLGGRTRPPVLDEDLLVHLELPRRPVPLALPGAVVYLERVGPALHCGIRFLPLALPAADDERERTLRRYLAEQQRRPPRRGPRARLRLFTGE